MPAIKKSANDHLRRMVKGAGEQTNHERRSKKSNPALCRETFQRLKEQIELHGKTIQKIPLDMIQLNENIRMRYDDKNLDRLANSLKNEGLIQFPTLCMREISPQQVILVCRNGHRRILAARKLAWTNIECVILPFDSVKDEFYHTLNANLKEDIFYLDLAFAYQEAHELGETDEVIASRVGVNPRTVGWYRRLTQMSPGCQKFCRDHPELFNATWAIKLARQGDLPEPKVLEEMMQKMIAAGKTWLKPQETSEQSSDQDNTRLIDKQAAQDRLKRMIHSQKGSGFRAYTSELLDCLYEAGFLSSSAWKLIQKDFLANGSSMEFVEKSLRTSRYSRRTKSHQRAKA